MHVIVNFLGLKHMKYSGQQGEISAESHKQIYRIFFAFVKMYVHVDYKSFKKWNKIILSSEFWLKTSENDLFSLSYLALH